MRKCKMQWKRGLACLAAAAVAMGSISIPAAAGAGQESLQEQNVLSGEAAGAGVLDSTAEDSLSNDELFEGYLEQLFYGDSGISSYALGNFDSGMDENEKVLYQALKTVVTEVAEGTRTGTEITLTDVTLTYPEAEAADQNAAISLANETISNTMDMILADCPYELYWFDKKQGYKMSYSTPWKEDGNYHCTVNKFWFAVAVDYAAGEKDSEGCYYSVNSEKVTRAQAAKTNAESIIEKHASSGDYDKLYAYLTEICDLVEYDTEAAESDLSVIGTDPWQLVSVFDGEEDTKVVCEGYAKAFAYLCEKSQFVSNKVNCYIVTGTIGAGHMWNIVTMDDGKNYMVDVTNCDGTSMGNPDKLFLAGLPGSVAAGYTYTAVNGQTFTFKYDDMTKELYPESILTLAEVDYYDTENADKKEQAALNFETIPAKTYGDADFTLSATGGSGEGEITYSVPKDNGVLTVTRKTDGSFIATIIGAGKMTITASKAGDDTYKLTRVTQELTVAKKSLTPSITGTVTKKHDGTVTVDTAAANTLAIALDGVLETDKEKVSAEAVFAYEDAETGDGKNVIATKITLTGSAAGNYVLNADTASAKVGKIEDAGSGGNTGGSTGGTTGGSTGGSTGGTTGGNTGGSTSGSTGGTTGGSTGGSTGTGSGTATPAASQTPVVSQAPLSSQSPAASQTPAVSQSPATSQTPAASQVPMASETPTASQAPSVSETPVASQNPEASEVPIGSEAPAATEKPSGNNNTSSKKPEKQVNVTAQKQNGITVKADTKADGTAAVSAVSKTDKATVTISSTVIVNSVKYKVTVIDSYAFKKCKEVTTISLPSTVTTIKKNAFSGTKKLKTIKINSKKAVTVKKDAFKGLDTKKMTVKITKKMPKKQFKKMKKNLKNAGFKGTIKRA